ncbi:Protein CBR-dhs-20 [Globodera pallida]|nr:Protein CBR-dhs-20 [Globodera pallida]
MFLFLLLLVPIYYALRYLWELIPLSNLSKRAVFVTGCDSGFGYLLALKLAQHGLPTYAGCLTKQGQDQLMEEAKKRGIGGKLKSVPLDITNDKSVKEASEFVRKDLSSGNNELWGLVNNAGIFSCYGPDAWTSIEDYKLSMEVNCWGTIRCCQAFLPLIKRSKGRFVSISSVAGRVSVPCGAPYSVAKYGVEAYMDAIRLELECWGIGCCILEPGMFRTKLIDATAMTARVDKAWQNLTPEIQEEYGEQLKNKFVASWNRLFKELASDRLDHVVDAYFHAVTARFPRYRYRVGWDAILLYIPYSFLPTGLADFVFRTITQLLSGDSLPAALEKQKNMLKKKLI